MRRKERKKIKIFTVKRQEIHGFKLLLRLERINTNYTFVLLDSFEYRETRFALKRLLILYVALVHSIVGNL